MINPVWSVAQRGAWQRHKVPMAENHGVVGLYLIKIHSVIFVISVFLYP